MRNAHKLVHTLGRSRRSGLHGTSVVLSLMLSACAGLTGAPSTEKGPVGTQRAQRVTESINLQGFPPEYQQGHTEGCAAVGVTPTPKPSGEPMYVQGWRDGYKRCSARRPN